MNSPENPPPTRSARRFRLQFGLRTLFVVVLLVSLALGRYVQNVRAQREAVAALEAAGAKVNYDSGDFAKGIENPRDFRERIEWATPKSIRDSLGIDFFRSVRSAGFAYNKADFPSALESLRDLPHLQHFEAHYALDEDLDHIAGHDELTDLVLWDSVISDAGLARVGQLESLECLELWVQDETLGDFPRQPITDAGLAKLANLRQLIILGLPCSSVSGAGLRHLEGMPELDSLDLCYTMVADEGLESLLPLKKLRVLDLTGTAITDKGLRILGEIKSLENLDVEDTLVTAEGVTRLKRRLPNADIDANLYEPETDEDYGNVALNRARALMRAERWRQAIETLNAPHASKLDPVVRTYHLGWCYAELRQWDEASQEFGKTLGEFYRRGWEADWSTGLTEQEVWQRIHERPLVFERVARARPNDADRWITSARAAVVAGQWSSATADYIRAMRSATHPESLAFEYGVSRLLAGDLPEFRRVCDRYLVWDQRVAKSLSADAAAANAYRPDYRTAAMLLSCVAPQGPLGAPRIDDWPHDHLTALAYYRASEFKKVLELRCPTQRGGGVHWFCCAMACQKLGRAAEARECYAKGVHWLERRMKYDRLCGLQQLAGDFLQTEALRREAKRLIFE